MAHVLTASYVTIATVDYSNRCSKIELTVEAEEKDVTTFASSGWKEVLGGLKSAGLSLQFKNSYVDDDIDEDLWALLGTVVAFAVRYSSGAISTANPEYQGSILIKELKPINGSVGDVAEFDVTFPTSGSITRDVTP